MADLTEAAARLGPKYADYVRRNAAWNAAARQTLLTTTPQIGAKWMNRLGVSAEWALEMAWGTAALSILASRSALKAKIVEMVNEDRKLRAEQAARAAPHPASGGATAPPAPNPGDGPARAT